MPILFQRLLNTRSNAFSDDGDSNTNNNTIKSKRITIMLVICIVAPEVFCQTVKVTVTQMNDKAGDRIKQSLEFNYSHLVVNHRSRK